MQGEANLYAFSSLSDEERIFRSNPAIEVTRDEFSLLHPFALLTFNVRNPIFRSPEVRKALAMSIDNKALAQAVPGGVRPMYGPIPPGSEWHSPVSTPYDPDEANRILDRAGYPRNENGIRFTVEIDYEPSAQFSLSILKYLQSQFIRTIGVYFRIRTAEDPGSWADRVTSGAFDVTMDELYGWHDPAIGIERIYATNTAAILWSNMSHYSNPEVDALFRSASAEKDPEGRKALYAALQERLFPRARRPLALHHPLRHDPQPQRPARRGSASRRPFTAGRSLLETPMSIMDKSIASRIALLLGLFCLVLCAFLISLLPAPQDAVRRGGRNRQRRFAQHGHRFLHQQGERVGEGHPPRQHPVPRPFRPPRSRAGNRGPAFSRKRAGKPRSACRRAGGQRKDKEQLA